MTAAVAAFERRKGVPQLAVLVVRALATLIAAAVAADIAPISLQVP